jgi:hypothetical protein
MDGSNYAALEEEKELKEVKDKGNLKRREVVKPKSATKMSLPLCLRVGLQIGL